jgi:hypothetical protein
MDKQYFLIIKGVKPLNQSLIEFHAYMDIANQFHNTLWSKGILELQEQAQKIIQKINSYSPDETPILLHPSNGLNHSLVLTFLTKEKIFQLEGHEVRNSTPRYHIQMPADWMEKKYSNWPYLTFHDKRELTEVELKKVDEFLKGQKDTGQFLFTIKSDEYADWEIKLIDFVQENGKEVTNG